MSTIERRSELLKPSDIFSIALDYVEKSTIPGNTTNPEKAANYLWVQGIIGSYYDFEKALRLRNNEMIYFFAAPKEYIAKQMPNAEKYGIQYPVHNIRNTFITPQFSLIIETEGKKAAESQLKDLKVSVFENLENLKKTGILYPKDKMHERIIFLR